MKVCIILDFVPFPIQSGGCQAVYSMIDGLRFEVTLSLIIKVSNSQKPYIAALRDKWPNVNFYFFRQKKDLKYILFRFAQQYVYKYLYKDLFFKLRSPSSYYSPAWIEFINQTIEQEKPDIIQTEFFANLDLVYSIQSHAKKIFVQHEIRYIVNNMSFNSSSYALSPCSLLASRKLKDEEIVAMNQYDAILTLNYPDKSILEEDGVNKPIFCSPVSVCQSNKRNDLRFDNKLVFVGSGGHGPNVESLRWFLENVWNEITKKHPSLSFHVIGSWDSTIVDSLSKYDRLVFEGFVPNLGEALEGSISIVPIIRGSGIRMKILDAVNYGSPFISTTIGVLGMGFEDSRDCFIADTPQDFVDKLDRLIVDENLRKQFYYNSFAVFNKSYSTSAIVKQRLSIYHEVNN